MDTSSAARGSRCAGTVARGCWEQHQRGWGAGGRREARGAQRVAWPQQRAAGTGARQNQRPVPGAAQLPGAGAGTAGARGLHCGGSGPWDRSCRPATAACALATAIGQVSQVSRQGAGISAFSTAEETKSLSTARGAWRGRPCPQQ